MDQYSYSLDPDQQWLAYKVEENDVKDWEPAFEMDSLEEVSGSTNANATEDEKAVKVKIDDGTILMKKSVERLFVYREMESNIVQIEDGKRGETNEEIKKIFLNNYYFKYDGTAEKADKIYAIKSTKFKTQNVTNNTPILQIPQEFRGSKLIEDGEAFGPIATSDDDPVLDEKVAFVEWGSDPSAAASWVAALGSTANTNETIRNYAEKVSLTMDSLGAFSMLENTHTLDADFIYKDFKELIVELGYFTKEELTDSKRVFAWVVPELISRGWPARIIDKKESEYGTYLHCKSDYKASKDESLASELESSSDLLTFKNGYSGEEDVVAPATGELLKYGTHERTNVDTGEKETVGYAVIRVLDKEDAALLGNFKDSKPSLKSGKSEYDLDSEKKSKYGYYLFYENYALAGVIGDVILIDGFDLADGHTSINSFNKDSESLYETDDIFEANDNETTRKVKANANAKETAKSACTISGKVYIKEGTIIGKTKNDSKGSSVSGNYIRIIMRTKDDEIVEDVEDYMKIDDGVGDPQPYEQDEDGNDMYRLASMIHHELCAGSGLLLVGKTRDESGKWIPINNSHINSIAKVCGYVALNKCLTEGKSLKDVLTSGAYGSAGNTDAAMTKSLYNSGPNCKACLKVAKWCLTWDCTTVKSSEGIRMTRNCVTESGYDVTSMGDGFEYFWCLDIWDRKNSNYGNDGRLTDNNILGGTESDGGDAFFLRTKADNVKYKAQDVLEYDNIDKHD